MTDGDALFAAVLAEPDEDTPRLVYADWLEENDRPTRAEFIRVQVAAARAPTREVLASEKTLLAKHEEEWLAPLKVPGGPLEGGAGAQFRRGFVEVVWLSARAFLDRAAGLFAQAPVRELRVTRATPEDFRRLMGSPRLGRLRGLDLSDRRLGDAAVAELVRSQFSASLRELRLRGCGLTDLAAHLLAEAGGAWPLQELDVSHNAIGPAGLDALRGRFGDAVRADGPEAA
ncbi:MAG TPA: TIGR02996 domain-containing protein [Gemmata sp.]|nr:TIGR02996 domain-containing protein [Gemmata sp.]